MQTGENPHIRSGSIIYDDVEVGDNFRTGHNVFIREKTKIGHNTMLGTNSVIDGNCTIGSYVSIQTGVYITAYTKIEDHVFIGPCVVTANDKYMKSYPGKVLMGPTIRKGAKIGANATLLPGVVIGEGAVVGAGSVVTRDVNPHTTVVGNPARELEEKIIC